MAKATIEVCDDDSDDTLSFAGMVQQGKDNSERSDDRSRVPADPNFEFRRSYPPSPSPADFLFSNGQLLPHSFPIINTKTGSNRKETRASPKSSRCPSSTSSRSTSINSRNSSNSNTSSSGSGGSGRRCLRQSSERRLSDAGRAFPKHVTFQPSPTNSRWQLLGSAGPTLMSSSSIRASRRNGNVVVSPEACRSKKEGEKQGGFFGWLAMACRECHALEPSKHVENNIIQT